MKPPREVDTQLHRLLPRLESARREILRYEEIGRRRPLSARDRDILGDAKTTHATLTAEVDSLEAIYNAKPWKRYFIVSGGHVHRGTSCSTCYPTTRYGWLVDLADCDEGAMIESHGTTACTICFPEAPVHPAWKRDEAERAAKAKKVCPESGKLAPARKPGHFGSRHHFRCPRCGYFSDATPSGNVRKHRPPKEKKE